MTITQTVEIPADHRLRLTIDIPQEIPAGKAANVILTFPGVEASAAPEATDSHPGESSNAAAWRKFFAAMEEVGYLPDDGDMPIRSKSTRTLPL